MRLAIALAALLAIAGASRRAEAGDAPDPGKAQAARTEALRARVREWCDARKLLISSACLTCRGGGVVLDRLGRTAPCPTCEGRKTSIPMAPFRKVHYEMRSPAWREREASRKELLDLYRGVSAASAASGFLRSYRIDSVEAVGRSFGRARVFEGTDSVSRESRWVAAADPSTKKEAWFLYSEETDGVWDETPSALPVPPGSVPKVDPLKAEELAALYGKIGLSKASHLFEAGQRDGKALVVSVYDPKAADARALDESIASDVVPVTRAALEALPDVASVRVVFLARWVDKFGAVAKKPYRTAEIAREAFAKIHFENLTREQQLALWEIKETAPPGESLWWKKEPDSAK